MVLAALACSGPDHPSRAECERIGSGGHTARPGLVVLRGSRLGAVAKLDPGNPASCSDPGRAALFLRAHALLANVPEALRPARVTIHASPTVGAPNAPVAGLEYHRESASLLVSAAAVDMERTVWLHELGHLRAATRLPQAEPAQSVLAALDEGVADYYAAVTAGRPRLGGAHAGAERDLAAPPAARADDWARLALPGGLDVHRMGWRFAGLAWQAEPREGALVRFLLACMGDLRALSGAGPGPVARAWLEGCPEAGRARVEPLLRAWMPELLGD